jgi:hypothetical protein
MGSYDSGIFWGARPKINRVQNFPQVGELTTQLVPVPVHYNLTYSIYAKLQRSLVWFKLGNKKVPQFWLKRHNNAQDKIF